MTGLISHLSHFGFEQCDSGEAEEGYEKVAIYARNDFWKHAALLRRDGKWVSKLGEDEDIEHDAPDTLEGGTYGTVHCFMKRPRA